MVQRPVQAWEAIFILPMMQKSCGRLNIRIIPLIKAFSVLKHLKIQHILFNLVPKEIPVIKQLLNLQVVKLALLLRQRFVPIVLIFLIRIGQNYGFLITPKLF